MPGSFLVGRAARSLPTSLAVAGVLIAFAASSDGADKPAHGSKTSASATGTQYRADADMQAVLDAHAALGPKPIETLDAAEARRQPTPADAVMAVLKKQGKDTSLTALVPGVTSIDQTIPGPAGQLPVRIYTPDG